MRPRPKTFIGARGARGTINPEHHRIDSVQFPTWLGTRERKVKERELTRGTWLVVKERGWGLAVSGREKGEARARASLAARWATRGREGGKGRGSWASASSWEGLSPFFSFLQLFEKSF